MNLLRWAWKYSGTRQALNPPKPTRAMTTVNGVTHRLIWADRNAGWRLRCSCGWIDPKVRYSESKAIVEGNRHALSARRQSHAVPSSDRAVETELNKAINDASTRMRAFSKLLKKQSDAGRQDPEFAAKLVELSQRSRSISLHLKTTRLAEVEELSRELAAAYDEAAKWRPE